MGTFCRAIFPNFDEYATGNVTFYLKMYVFRPSSAIFQYLAADLGLLRVRKRFRRGHIHIPLKKKLVTPNSEFGYDVKRVAMKQSKSLLFSKAIFSTLQVPSGFLNSRPA